MIRANSKIALGIGTALVAVLLPGCATTTPRADLSASAAQEALAEGESDRAIPLAEAAVLNAPHDAGYRLLLGNAYLEAGRFASAETAFTDAMALGDTSPRAALSLALAQIGQGEYAAAATLLNDWEGDIAPADLGLALALAGQPERGIHIMTNAIRGGENTVKMRQNLAYAYAIAGRWREARLMTQQDVPAGEVDARMEHWARMASAEAYQHRVADLLQVPAGVRDSGQPLHLALVNTPLIQQAAAPVAAPVNRPAAPQVATAAPVAAPAPAVRELPALASAAPAQPVAFAAPAAIAAPEPTPQTAAVVAAAEPVAPARTQSFAAAFAPPPAVTAPAIAPAAPAPAPAHAMVAEASAPFFSAPLVQDIPARAAPAAPRRAAAPAPAAPVVAAAANGDHLVQLGSFLSEAGARRAWDIYVRRYPELASREMVITPALVRGRNFWRVSAGGFTSADSRAMCSRVRSRGGEGCVTWAEGRPLPGAIDTGVRLARR